MRRYGRCVSGCMAQMLVGQKCGNPRKLSPTQVAIAVSNVARLGFVGLQEEWQLSVCLFHVRFGGTCQRSEFENVRPSAARHRYAKVQATVKMTDESWPDEAVYQAVAYRFWHEIEFHNVTHARCAR